MLFTPEQKKLEEEKLVLQEVVGDKPKKLTEEEKESLYGKEPPAFTD